MGVRKLNKFLTSKQLIRSYRNINDFINNIKDNNSNNCHNGKTVIAIDFWLYAHKFLHSSRSDNILLGFWNQIMKFFSYGIIPLYVMDGSVPIEKQDKIKQRKKRESNNVKKLNVIEEEIEEYINISDLVDNRELEEKLEKKEKLKRNLKRIKTSELKAIHKLFDQFSVPYIKASFEADALCAKLYKENIITACLSDDMDMLALGCGSTIKFQEGKLIEFNLEMIKKKLGFTQDQFIDMCIMFGCDYLQHPFRIECEDIYEMIKKHGSLLDALFSGEHEIFNMSNNNVKVIGENYYQVQKMYKNSIEKEIIPHKLQDLKLEIIDFQTLVTFLKKLHWFDTSAKNLKSIENDINGINTMIHNDIM